MDDSTTYDVRVYRSELYKGARVTTYRVRWKVGPGCGQKASAMPLKPTASAVPY
jgi:hypothetical protein